MANLCYVDITLEKNKFNLKESDSTRDVVRKFKLTDKVQSNIYFSELHVH